MTSIPVYTPPNQFSAAMAVPVYLFTFNANKRGANDTLGQRLATSFPSTPATIFVFGLEEMGTIIEGAYGPYSRACLRDYNELFLDALNQHYGADSRFHTVGMVSVGAIGLIAITPYPLRFSNVREARTSCGYGFSSLKGAAALRVTYSSHGTSLESDTSVEFTFANAHLSAYEGEYYYQKRNQNINSIMRSLDFGDGHGFIKPGSHSFFMGDLNYRTTKKYSKDSEESKQLRRLQDQSQSSKQLPRTLHGKYDELSHGKNTGEILTGFSEGDINFNPTYKLVYPTAIYSTKRSPSWCDRIFYQSTYRPPITSKLAKGPKEKMLLDPVVHSYDSIDVLLSDHQPVYMNITVPFHPPESIVNNAGYLQVLPSDRESESSFSGPTLIYMRPAALDRVVQRLVRPVVDTTIAVVLAGTTKPRGRLLVLGVALLLFGAYAYVFRWW